jgi:hypothetical protein
MKNNCHFLLNSFFHASAIILSLKLDTTVLIACLQTGGVVSIDILFIQFKAILRLLGMGVADIASISIFHFNSFIFSLSFTQNLCSSSIINSHKSFKIISSLSNLWVQIIKSIFHVLSFSIVFFIAPSFSNLVNTSIFIGKFANLSFAFSKCS